MEEKDCNVEPSITLDDALDDLTVQQLMFWQHMNTGKHTQVEAYRMAFAKCTTDNKNVVQVKACKLWNSDKFKICKSALNDSIAERSARTKEQRIARLERVGDKALDDGNYGAAVQAEVNCGKLEGHYIERHENVTKGKEFISRLKRLAPTLGQEKTIAMAKAGGLNPAEMEVFYKDMDYTVH